MKAIFAIILAFVSVTLAEELHDSTGQNSDRYLKSISQVRKQLMLIDTEYEQFKVSSNSHAGGDNQQIVSLINKIKHNKSELSRLKSEIGLILATMKTVQLVDRMFLEYARILCDAYSDALNRVAFELLGYQAKIYEFKETYVSELINIEANLMKADVEQLIVTLVDVDHRIGIIMNHTSPDTDRENKLKILNELTQTTNGALNLKVRMTELLMRESQTAHDDNKELNILQNADLDSGVQMLNFLIQFMHTYQQLVERLLGQCLDIEIEELNPELS